MSRRGRGEVQAVVLNYVTHSSPDRRYTPYALAAALGISAGSVTAAVKALVRDEKVMQYGNSPLIVGRK